MNITLVGYGRMGEEVARGAHKWGHRIVARVDPQLPPTTSGGSIPHYPELSPEAVEGSDGIIEFALPKDIINRITFAATRKIPYVIGTTGWDRRLEEARAIVKKNDATLLFGSNFSIGVGIFSRLVEKAASIINAYNGYYDIMMTEAHHRNKKDSPSGTALTIANKIIAANQQKTRICTESLQRKIEADELHIASLRGGDIPGMHRVILDSPADSITLEHNARNRSGFASGAIIGLEWLLKDRKGFFTIDDFFNDFMRIYGQDGNQG